MLSNLNIRQPRRQHESRANRCHVNQTVRVPGRKCRLGRALVTGHGGVDCDSHKCNIPGREGPLDESERIE